MLRVSFLTALLCFCFTSIVFGLSESSPKNQYRDKGVTEEKYYQTKGIIPAYDPRLPEGSAQNIFATKVKDGSIELSDISIIATYWIDWMLELGLSIAVLAICFGGWQYVIGSATDDKERGKKSVINACAGIIVMYFAWTVIKLLQRWVTIGSG